CAVGKTDQGLLIGNSDMRRISNRREDHSIGHVGQRQEQQQERPECPLHDCGQSAAVMTNDKPVSPDGGCPSRSGMTKSKRSNTPPGFRLRRAAAGTAAVLSFPTLPTRPACARIFVAIRPAVVCVLPTHWPGLFA